MNRNRTLVSFALFMIVCAVFVWHALYYLPFTSDDALISLRYAKRFASGLGLTWTDGERVEGYTDLLWVLMNALLGHWLNDYLLSARIFGTLGGLLAIFFVSLTPPGLRIDTVRLMTGGMALALSASLAAWAVGGLEHSFMAGIIAAAFYFLLRGLNMETPDKKNLVISGFFFGLVAITRADGILFFGGSVLGIVLSLGIRKKMFIAVAIFSILPALIFGAQFIFRVFYYDAFVPNTALAKIAFNTQRLFLGLTYAKETFTYNGLLLIAGAVGVFLSIRKTLRHRWIIPSVCFVLWVTYIILVGGDIFHARRQLLPAFVPLAFLFSEGVAIRRADLKRYAIAAVVATAVLLGGHFWLQFKDPRCHELKELHFWEIDVEPVGKLLKKAFGRVKPLVAVDAAGALPFWCELPALDMLGLNDRYLATHPPKTFGKGGIGHELGDGQYLLRRSPDIVVFSSGLGNATAFWPGARQMSDTQTFKNNYVLATAKGVDASGEAVITMHIKRESTKIGIRRLPDEIRIPGVLFSASSRSPALLGKNDQLYTPINGRRSAQLLNIPVPEGTWQLSTRNPTPSSGHRIICEDGIVNKVGIYRPEAPVTITVSSATRLGIFIEPPQWLVDDISLYEVILKKVPDREATFRCVKKTTTQVVSLDALSVRKMDRTPWTHPDNIVFSEAGIKITFSEIDRPASLAVSLDSNDRYIVEYFYQGERLGTSTIEPDGTGGLHEYTVAIPEGVAAGTLDMVFITPDGGDNMYSIGHLFLHQSAAIQKHGKKEKV